VIEEELDVGVSESQIKVFEREEIGSELEMGALRELDRMIEEGAGGAFESGGDGCFAKAPLAAEGEIERVSPVSREVEAKGGVYLFRARRFEVEGV
jgi:hypothetical protein